MPSNINIIGMSISKLRLNVSPRMQIKYAVSAKKDELDQFLLEYDMGADNLRRAVFWDDADAMADDHSTAANVPIASVGSADVE